MDSYQQFAIYQRVEIGKGERTIQAYLGDVQRFRGWLDNHAVVRGLPPAWEEVEARLHRLAFKRPCSHQIGRAQGRGARRRPQVHPPYHLELAGLV